MAFRSSFFSTLYKNIEVSTYICIDIMIIVYMFTLMVIINKTAGRFLGVLLTAFTVAGCGHQFGTPKNDCETGARDVSYTTKRTSVTFHFTAKADEENGIEAVDVYYRSGWMNISTRKKTKQRWCDGEDLPVERMREVPKPFFSSLLKN